MRTPISDTESMSEERPSNGSPQQSSWLERISQTLSGEPRNRDDLLDLLRESQKRHLFDSDALSMIEGVLQVSEMQVRDIMIPRSQMIVIEREATRDEILRNIVETAHSRYPVIGESRDEVAGILLAKDMLLYAFEKGGRFSVRDVLRPAVFIPESKRLNVLLKDFRSSRNHLAIVVDEYGGVAGMVTIEDVLEQIVGEIEDEHDIDEDTFILKHSDVNYTLKALTPIDDFNEYFDTRFNDDEFDTVGGLVLNGFGRVPKRGETYVLEGRYRFKVVRSDNRRIHLLQMSILPEEEAAPERTGLAD